MEIHSAMPADLPGNSTPPIATGPEIDSGKPRKLTQAYTILLAMIVTGGVLAWLLVAAHTDMSVPVRYGSDSLYHLTVFKGIAEGNAPWRNARLAAPQAGSDWLDFPAYQWVDFIAFRLFSLFTADFIRAFNLYWVLTVILTAGTAAYSFLRLRASPLVAFCLAFLYATQPFVFVRNITHFVLVCYLVPLLATACIELALGRWEVGGRASGYRSIPAYAWIAFLLQGVSFFYFSFFAGLLLLVAAIWASCARRTLCAVRHSVWLLLALSFSTVVGVSPTVIHWLHSGVNPAAIDRNASQSESNGLRVRHMFDPVPEHPLPFMRALTNKAAAEHPEVTEALGARLGVLGSVGFTALILFSLLAPTGWKLRSDDGTVAICSSLVLAASLWCLTGGFGSAFNTWVSPLIRGYNRIIVFIVFFVLTAYGSLATTVLESRPRSKAQRRWGRFGLIVLTGLAFLDVLWFVPQSAEMREQAAAERQLVERAEKALGGQGMVYQLPYTPFPSGGGPVRMAAFDQLRPYIQSRSLRWSWGATINTEPFNWATGVSQLAPESMLPELIGKGFSGVLIDTFGYEHPETGPASQLAAVLGRQSLVSSDGRYVFFDIRGFKGLAESVTDTLPTLLNQSAIRNDAACSVDQVNHKAPANARISIEGGGTLRIDGWLGDTNGGVALPNVYLELTSAEGKRSYLHGSRYDRPDVVAAFKKPGLLHAGFAVSANVNKLPRGIYTTRFLQLGSTNIPQACATVITFDLR